MKEYQKKYYRKNKERMKLQTKRWQKKNRDKIKAWKIEWKNKNPEKYKKMILKAARKSRLKRESSKEFQDLQLKAKHLIVDWNNKKQKLGLSWKQIKLPNAPLKVKKMACQRIASGRIQITDLSKCKKCGKKRKELRLEKHHPDYNWPLKVIILCYKCHQKIHRKR